MKKLSLLLAFITCSLWALAQQPGSVEGTVTNKEGKPSKNVLVEAYTGGALGGQALTDQFGKFTIKPLSAGEYIVVAYRQGKKDTVSVLVSNGSATSANFKFNAAGVIPGIRKVGKASRPPIKIDEAKIGASQPLDATKIERLATTSTADAAKLIGGGYQAKAGQNVSFGGTRGENTIYMIDGIMVRNGAAQLPVGTVQQLSVNMGGMAANLGDATGAIISLTSKGMTAKTTGSINYQGSVDGYNGHQLNLNLRGPIWTKKDTAKGTQRTIMGYSLGIGLNYDQDPDPFFYRYTVVKDEVRQNLEQNPLRAVPQANGSIVFRNAAEYLTNDDFTTIKARKNGASSSININGKLQFQPTKEIGITLGGATILSQRQGWSFFNSLMAPDANAVTQSAVNRAYVRLTQKLSKDAVRGEIKEKTLIANPYYSIQLSYENVYSNSKHARHGDNIFAYGYLGKFTQYTRDYYVFDTVAGGYKGLRNVGQIFDSLTFQADNSYNPNFTAYTDYIYNNLDYNPSSLNSLIGLGGLGNGNRPGSVHNLFNNIGSNVNGYNKSTTDQYSLAVDASFDINTGLKRSKLLNKDVSTTHAIEFGGYYEQRINRNYGLSAGSIWELMRSITNQHILDFDYANPIFRVDGQDYSLAQVQAGLVQVSAFDSVNFLRKVDAKNPESFFSKNLRNKLGLGANNIDFLYIDQVATPDKLSLDMFSPDDLFNQGSAYVGYSGYDYLGRRYKSRPSFNDFWTKKDDKGNYARPIAPFNPIYVAGYIQDNFKYKDMRFRVGVRVDRYDANQKVLRDPYSLVAGYKVSDLQAGTYALAVDASQGNAKAPDPLSADFKAQFSDASVYVNDNEASTPTIVGYRKGDVWYDPFGREISDPSIINANYTGGKQLAPYIINKADIKKDRIKDADFDLNSAFTDYKPRVNISPRISFSFPIDYNEATGGVNSQFYAHYDIVTQRPGAGFIFATPDDYYFINERGQSQTLANANLSPEQKVDYEFGFQQQLTSSSLIKLSAAYIERKNQVQVQRLVGAYPLSYETYGNRDFSTVKQFITEYSLRPQGKYSSPLEMTVAYTLQFAEGTGSNAGSQRNIIANGQPNLRTVMPLDFDSRHTIVLNLDYRYGGDSLNRGPAIGRFHPFKNVGLNTTVSARSGEPYTRVTNVIPLDGFGSGNVSGSLNGSRRPWSYTIDCRLDKDFVFLRKNKPGITLKPKQNTLNVYLLVQNLLNTRNILSVYNYTGLADNDGFLDSPQGIQRVNSVVTNQQSYVDMYTASLLNPGRFVNPRRIFIGINFGLNN
jgi:hypothetical protein